MLSPLEYNPSNKDDVKIRVRRKVDFHLANVDLEVECPADLQPLIDEFGDRAMALYHQGFENNRDMANFEIMYYPSFEADIYQSFDDAENFVGGADTLVSAFCDLLENLSPESRLIWEKCTRREFDIGFVCGNTAKSFRTEIRTETVKRCADFGAKIVMTVYPHFNYEYRSKKEIKKKKKLKK